MDNALSYSAAGRPKKSKKETSEEEDADDKDESDEDEPLTKKGKQAFPTVCDRHSQNNVYMVYLYISFAFTGRANPQLC